MKKYDFNELCMAIAIRRVIQDEEETFRPDTIVEDEVDKTLDHHIDSLIPYKLENFVHLN